MSEQRGIEGLSVIQAKEKLDSMAETIREIDVKVSFMPPIYKAFADNAKRCHDTLKAFNDEHFPRGGDHVSG